MTDMNELVLNRLIAEVKAHADTKSELNVALEWCSKHRAEAERVTEQNETLTTKLETVAAELIDSTATMHSMRFNVMENNSLKAELERLADQHKKTVDALRDLAFVIEANVRRPVPLVKDMLKRVGDHLSLIEPL